MGPAGEQSSSVARCHLPRANVPYPCSLSISAIVAADGAMTPRQFENPESTLEMNRMPTEW